MGGDSGKDDGGGDGGEEDEDCELAPSFLSHLEVFRRTFLMGFPFSSICHNTPSISRTFFFDTETKVSIVSSSLSLLSPPEAEPIETLIFLLLRLIGLPNALFIS